MALDTLHSLFKQSSLVLITAAGIAACGGDSGSDIPPSSDNEGDGGEEPVATGSFTDASLAPGATAKTLSLQWAFEGEADSFNIEINPDGNSGFVTLDLDGNGVIDQQDRIDGSETSRDLLVPLHWLSNPDMMYRLVARDQGGAVMDATGSLSVAPASLNALVTYLKASNTEATDEFGYSLALSGDGKTLAVGAPEEASQSSLIDGSQGNDGYSVGAVYVFHREENGNWAFQAYVKPSDADRGDVFGRSLSLSADGDTLVVGVPGDDGDDDSIYDSSVNYGAAVVFNRNVDGDWTQDVYLRASNKEENDGFGRNVTISGDGNTIAVAAPEEDSAATHVDGDEDNNDANGTGAVYVFSLAGEDWQQQAYIKASNTDPLGDDGYAYEEDYGGSLSLSHSGDVLAVAAPNEDSAATGVDGSSPDKTEGVGAVYTYQRDGSDIWSHQSYIKPPVAGWNDAFGNSLSLSGDGQTLAVGQGVEDSASTVINGSMDGVRENSGAVHVLRYLNDNWSYQAFIKASNANEHDQLGTSVDLSYDGNILVTGAANEGGGSVGLGGDPSSNGAYRSGAVYMFAFRSGQWQEHSYIKAPNAESRDYFGKRVALSDDGQTLAVVAPEEDSSATGVNGDQSNNEAADAGAVYVY